MATSTDENPSDIEMFNDAMQDDDDETVTTETLAPKIEYIAEEMIEYTLRYEIPFHNGHVNNDDYKHHANLLKTLTTAFDSTELRIIDNKNQRVTRFDQPKWQDAAYYKSHFNIHSDDAQRKSVIAHRIRSKESISSLKSESTVLAFLKLTHTYLRAHFWKEDEIRLSDVGFLTRYIPSHHNKDFVIRDMSERIDFAKDQKWASTNPKPPPFKLIHSQPRLRINNKTLKTQAYSIQVLSKDAPLMNQHLRKLYADEQLFIPYSTKKKHPELVAKAIVRQNQKITETYVIVVVGITRELMNALEPSLQSIKGVIEYSETNKTDKHGRWNIIVDDRHFKTARKNIATNMKHWIKQIPSRILETCPAHFPSPQVNQQYGDADDEDSSAGHASYMSSCAQSYGEFDETDEATMQYFTPANTSTMSYAAAVNSKPNSTATPMVKEVTIRDTETRLLIAGLQAEIATLKLQQGHQTPSTVTATSTPDNRTIDRIEQVETSMTDLRKWMSEMVTLMRDQQNHSNASPSNSVQGIKHPHEPVSPPSHQTKRANTGSTPDRHNLQPPNYEGPGGYDDGHYNHHPYGPYFPPPYNNGYNYQMGPPPPPPHYPPAHHPFQQLFNAPPSMPNQEHTPAHPQSRPAADAQNHSV